MVIIFSMLHMYLRNVIVLVQIFKISNLYNFHWYYCCKPHIKIPLQWRHDGAIVSQITSLKIVYSAVYSDADKKKTSKLCVTGLCAGNSSSIGEFPAQMASNAEKKFPFDDVIMTLIGSYLFSLQLTSVPYFKILLICYFRIPLPTFEKVCFIVSGVPGFYSIHNKFRCIFFSCVMVEIFCKLCEMVRRKIVQCFRTRPRKLRIFTIFFIDWYSD